VSIAGGPDGRREGDQLGYRNIPHDALWGIHTLRAMENFPMSGERIGDVPELIDALTMVKEAAATANASLRLLDPDIAHAIIVACQKIRTRGYDDQFPIPLLQGGAGTSTNMNANEVIANLALEQLGLEHGTYQVIHPNQHVNLGQSTNDVYPTALRLSTYLALRRLVTSLDAVAAACELKAVEFEGVIKMGRTQLQDAVPLSLGRVFGSYAVTIREDIDRIADFAPHLLEVNLGGTAVGTGLNAHPQYADRVKDALEEVSGLDIRTSADLVEATQDVGAFVLVSALVKRAALKLSKISSDLRLLSSGPRAGFGEISLPARQAGSSIMPGKVNPVIPELVNQVAFEILGFDVTISAAAEAGQLELNAFEPVIAVSLHRGISHLSAAATALAEYCIEGIVAHPATTRAHVMDSIGIVTALSPRLGYETANDIARDALQTRRSVAEVVLERGLIPDTELADLLDPDVLARGSRLGATDPV
jgi:aspartate ammonia-lyase